MSSEYPNKKNTGQISTEFHVITLNQLPRSLKDRQLNISDTPLKHHLELHNLTHLPQAKLLEEVSALLTPYIKEAYLRGSFSSGQADDYSDIDLFLVVEKEKLVPTFKKFIKYSEEKHNLISICHDKLVADYGGVGFMALLGDKNTLRTTQLDLYLSVVGSRPKKEILNVPRIVSNDKNYSIFCEKEKLNDYKSNEVSELISIISRHDNKEIEDIRQDLHDLVVTSFIMSKHIKRGQIARAKNDDFHATELCIDLFRRALDLTTDHSSLYFGDHLLSTSLSSGTNEQQAVANLIKNMLESLPSHQQVENIRDFITTYTNNYYPALSEEFAYINNQLSSPQNNKPRSITTTPSEVRKISMP